METRSKIDRLPGNIKDELIEKVLTGSESSISITQWLLEQHGIKTSKTAVWRFSKIIRNKYSVLVKLGMPIKEIIKHRLQIEAVGVGQVAQQILDKMIEKIGPILAYLDKAEGNQ